MKNFLAVIALVVATSAACAETIVPSFKEETATSGLKSIYKGDWQYMVGGGITAFDCSGDGKPEIYAAGGLNKAKLFINNSKPGGTLKFSEARKTGLEFDHVTGAYPLDIDGDGILDLVVLRVGENKIMRGLGNCKFTEANKLWNIDGGNAWHSAFSATWEKGNRLPTLAFGTYIDPKFEDDPWGHCGENTLLRPNVDQKSYAAPIKLNPSFCTLSMLFTDWNHSGIASLRVSNDREYYMGGQEQMWKVLPGEAPKLFTEAEGWKFIRLWGMGIATADFNNSGFPSYFLSSMADQRMQILADGAAKPAYKEAQFAMGTTAHKPYAGGDERPSTGWHTQFEDVNNDGRYDLFIAKGNVDQMPDFAQKDPNNLLLQKEDGTFMEAGEKAGILSFRNHRGAQLVDLNADGKLDLVVSARHENLQAWRNVSTTLGHFLEIKLQDSGPNRNAIGALVEVKEADGKVMARENYVGGGHMSGQAGFLHFGIGAQKETQIRVRWPDGTQGAWQAIKADKFAVVEKPGTVKVLK
ncbi:MAG: CRTAC1 family protein [Alphaproteobacteria bacterium]|nr:CRTAC1 family protein [Alphaproteobacteria bacterium]